MQDFDPHVRKIPGEGNDNPGIIAAWELPRTEEPGGCSPWGRRVGHDLSYWNNNNRVLKTMSGAFVYQIS